jgi:hypothetical protein
MDVSTISVDPAFALQKLDEYKQATKNERHDQDVALRRAYKLAAKYRLINVAAALKETGLNEKGQPRLALARADWKNVAFTSGWIDGVGTRRCFSHTRWLKDNYIRYVIPDGIYPTDALTKNSLSSPVPHIPPSVRPKYKLENYHILFEVKSWEEYPADPYLLRHVHGWIYAVVAEWELSPLELMILGGV